MEMMSVISRGPCALSVLPVALFLSTAVVLPSEVWAHAKGLYKTQAVAEKRARELGCKGTHRNNGQWMPCAHEAKLHQELRKE
jgi:hypothetical protein